MDMIVLSAASEFGDQPILHEITQPIAEFLIFTLLYLLTSLSKRSSQCQIESDRQLI